MPIIQVQMLTGRSHAQKQELSDVLTRETARITRCAAEDIQIVITEVPRANWALGGKLGEPAAQPAG
ncbi:tautomerase family protein [Pseudaquabacterium rugosum]|uniref:Tautomerase family protein n=1 Tax=Pseudaquabacterium rugosum TaxID=2984194 RepID=A0ABU9B7T6_9BURK